VGVKECWFICLTSGSRCFTTVTARVGAWDIRNSLDPMFHHNVQTPVAPSSPNILSREPSDGKEFSQPFTFTLYKQLCIK